MTPIYYILVFGILIIFGAMVIWALWWAMRGGQFSNFAQGATSIFDEDEPVGEITDAFPDKKDKQTRSQDHQQGPTQNEDSLNDDGAERDTPA